MELSGKKVTANLGSGSSVTSIGSGIAYAEGVVVSNQSSLQAEALSISTQGTNGIALRVSGYGSNVDSGNGSSIQTNGTNSHGVQVDTLTGDAINGVATLKAETLTINTWATPHRESIFRIMARLIWAATQPLSPPVRLLQVSGAWVN